MAARWWLLPGTLCTAEVFGPLLHALNIQPRDCRTVRLDRPLVSDYAEELTEVAPEDIVLGFSLGAILAAHYANRISARAIVLLSANPFADIPEKCTARLDLLVSVSSQGARPVVSRAWSAMVGAKARHDAMIGDRIVAMAEATITDLLAQTSLALTRPGAGSMLSDARSPLLFVTGSEDYIAPRERAERAAAAGSHALTLVEGAGHFLPLEAPLACADAIVAFLKIEKVRQC